MPHCYGDMFTGMKEKDREILQRVSAGCELPAAGTKEREERGMGWRGRDAFITNPAEHVFRFEEGNASEKYL